MPRVLIALTNDPALGRAVQELVASGIEVGIVQSAQALSDELLQHSSAIALIDCATVDSPIESLVDAIAKQFPDMRLLVAGHSADQTLLATRIERQTVFRFVHKPASAQRLKLFLDAVGRQSDAPRAAPASDASLFGAKPVKVRTNPGAGTRSALGAGGSKSGLTAIGIGLGIVLAIGLGVWLFWPKGGEPSVQTHATTVPGTAATAGPAGELVGKADQAFAAGRYVGTDGTSAAELYRDVLKIDSKNDIARSGFDRSIEFGLRTAEEALLASRVDSAAAIAENLRLLVPGNSRLAFLQAQIDKESARVNADTTQRQIQDARQVRIKDSLDSMAEAMGRGALLDPARNNAILHFRAAAEVNAADPAVRNARESLVAALLTAADNELAAQHLAPATRLVDAAASINSGAPGLDVLRRRVRELQSAAVVQAAAPAVTPAAQPAAELASPVSARTADSQETIVAESTLQRLSKVDPVYPQRALEQLTSGWVELQFTVGSDGTVHDVVVVDAQPRATFDKSAITALRRWRYTPVIRDGIAVPQRAQVRMRFTATDQKKR
ncbi:MAG: energy transducer TonB [Pseudomonadota bacterium]